MSDIIIIGGGPAGVSAALTARNRGKSVFIISNDAEQSNLWKAREITNYPGCPGMSGADILKSFRTQLDEAGIKVFPGRALNAVPMSGRFGVSVGENFFDAGALILASGVVQAAAYEGELEYLGRGVSYCATCDGMLYRGKKVAVIGLSGDAESEADALRDMGVDVMYFDKTFAKNYKIIGEQRVTAIEAEGREFPVDGVFILRSTIAPSSFLSGLELDEWDHIKVDREMRTNIPGVFAAGDCVGKPYQIAKAVGDGNIAALSACAYLDGK
ncbi:MAG: NAD(P)/FAD-dependent oxidoreductase [Oscillospiraceae bacterium]|jgi:thioredoxin reductase (NADPH)